MARGRRRRARRRDARSLVVLAHVTGKGKHPLNPGNVAKQRQLNDKGRADAKAVGEALKTAGVPIGKSYSSHFSEGGLVVSSNENNRRTQAFRALLGATPDGGTNTLIVTHKPNILDALGKDGFDVREGEASIFKPEGGGKYSLVTRVQIGQWVVAKR